jgi:hypothetical protein
MLDTDVAVLLLCRQGGGMMGGDQSGGGMMGGQQVRCTTQWPAPLRACVEIGVASRLAL